MAFLYKFPNRPACIVSALPKRYREPLERELAGSVAISTCSVDQLESTVKMRGATMAVVGINGDSLNVAERLSHTTREVKVFLAHYKEPAKAITNGFAGVFDLRVEPERLTARIRESVHDLNRTKTSGQPCPRLQRRQLDRFLEMQKKLANQTALFDSILHHALQVADAREGLLLLPQEGLGKFRVVTSSSDEAGLTDAKFSFSRPSLKSLQNREITLVGSEEGFITCTSGFAPPHFDIAMPIVNSHGLCACILADSANQSDDLHELLEGIGFLFQELIRNEAKNAREKLLSQARDAVGSGWALTDSRGRVLYREGRDGSWISQYKPRIEEARVLDLIKRVFTGNKASTKVRGRLITGHTISTENGSYCVLETKEPNRSELDDAPSKSEGLLLTSVIKQGFAAASTERRQAVEVILRILHRAEATPFPAKEMEEAGANVKPSWTEIPTSVAGPIALIVLASNSIAGELVSASYKVAANEWFLTVELPEKRAGEKPIKWADEPLMRAALRISGLGRAKFSCGLFGFQLAGALDVGLSSD